MLSGRHGPLAGWITGYMNVFGQVNIPCISIILVPPYTQIEQQPQCPVLSFRQRDSCLIGVWLTLQVALLAGQVYSLVQLLSVMIALSTEMAYGQPYLLTPAEVYLKPLWTCSQASNGLVFLQH